MGIEKGRIGQFFIFLGAIALIVFFTTGNSTTPPTMFFLVGAALLIFGIFLMWKDWKPGPQSGRFRILKGSKRRKEKKEEQK
jgi:multisubunit Na+/H+ antiporter MnhG subunit